MDGTGVGALLFLDDPPFFDFLDLDGALKPVGATETLGRIVSVGACEAVGSEVGAASEGMSAGM